MITVAEAEHIILQSVRDYGTEMVHFQSALGRVLAEDIVADRDMPAGNRSTMDGVAISFDAFENGVRSFRVNAIQAAGDVPVTISDGQDCVEIMTGAVLSESVDTVIRYEDLKIENGVAILQIEQIRRGQSIHKKGADKKEGEVIIKKGGVIDAAAVGVAAFAGKMELKVTRLPRIVLFSNGDELVEVGDNPPPYKIRRSNTYSLQAALKQMGMDTVIVHLPDEEKTIEQKLSDSFDNYDVVMLSGGVSMGKYDLVADALEKVGVRKLFHKVQQRPGKPFWFGEHEKGPKVFAFPGNHVSTFMCFHRYFVPWFSACMGMEQEKQYAVIAEDVHFEPALQYFVQVQLQINEKAQLVALPVEGNGSGDLTNLVNADAFMELPMEKNLFNKGDVYRIWPFKPLCLANG
jgi:molybdopterin molybdotransferase